MPRELDASWRWVRCSATEVESAGPSCSPKCCRLHLLSAVHQNFLVAAFNHLSRGLATYFTAPAVCCELNFFFS